MDEQIYTVIANVLCGEATEDEQAKFNEWLREDEGHKKTFDDICHLWKEADTLIAAPSFNKKAAWEKVSAATIDKPKQTEKAATIAFEPKRSVFPNWLKVNIGVAAALLIGFFFYQSFYYYGDVAVVAGNENMEITLPDNSHITLHSGSKLSYPRHFDKHERHVALNGEAFFDVTRNEKLPFTIDANATNVKVLGTSFDVLCNNSKALVTVKTGKVSVTNADKKNEIIVTPGEQAVVNGNEVSKKILTNENYLYWKTGVFTLKDVAFGAAISDIVPLLGKPISFDASVTPEMKQQLINGEYRKQSLEEILTEMCLVANCKWANDSTHYTISMK